jgi:hypothetical protein
LLIWVVLFFFCLRVKRYGGNVAVVYERRTVMKKQKFKTLLALNLLLILTAVSVFAQSSRSKVTNIPFSFTVGNKTLPAGQYTFERYRKDSDNVWLIQSRDGRSKALVTTQSIRSIEPQEKSKIVFRRYGRQYFLSQIWTVGDTSGRELRVSRPKSDLAQNSGEGETVVLTAGSDK